MPASDLKKAYARALQTHGFGYAFYEPPASAIDVGTAGYIDSSGTWTPMFNVTDSAATRNKGLTEVPAGKVRSAEQDKQTWGPKLSTTVKAIKEDLSVGLSGALWGIPADASVAYSFSNSSSEGAMLLTFPDVSVQRLYDESIYIDWAKKNVVALFKLHPDAKKKGFYIVTSTYNTRRCATVAWSNPEKKVVLGFKADVAGLGEVAPSSEWYLAKQSDGVNYFQAEDGKEKTVVFGGIFFKVRAIRISGHEVKAVDQTQWQGRSAENAPTSFESHDNELNEQMEIEMTNISDPEADVPDDEPDDEPDEEEF